MNDFTEKPDKRIVIDANPYRTRAVLTENGKVVEICSEQQSRDQHYDGKREGQGYGLLLMLAEVDPGEPREQEGRRGERGHREAGSHLAEHGRPRYRHSG